MNIYIIGLFTVGGFLTVGLLATIYFNFFKIRKTKEKRSNRLKYCTAAYLCIAGAFAYFAYLISCGDWLRGALSPVLLVHAVLMFLLIFAASKHAHKSENLPGQIRMCLTTFSIAHLTIPSFVGGGAFALFKLVQDLSMITVSFMIAIFMMAINLIMMVLILIKFFKVRND